MRKSRLRKTFLILLLLFIAATSYVLIVNRDSPQMTTRQKYQGFLSRTHLGKWIIRKNTTVSAAVQAPVSFFNKAYKTDGTLTDLSLLKGKNPGCEYGFRLRYTAQLAELEELQQKYATTVNHTGLSFQRLQRTGKRYRR
jgi:hypothetical protein